MKILGIIPARGGSKGVPGKNILSIDGKPLLSYAIECGKESKKITKLLVSTDSREIAKIAENYKAEVMLRPETLATDTSDVADTVGFILEEFKKNEEQFDIVVLLQPTAPLRTGRDVDQALELLEQNNTDAVISMVKVGDNHPARMYDISENKIHALHPELEKTRRQELPTYYMRNGCIYGIKTDAFFTERNLMPSKKSAYIMNEKWWVNVDTPTDIYILEHLMPLWKKENAIK
ncbi:cytidylyltransferase domain-containing protein [Flavimarina sp. Hel_I_48]|uniref:acylneuraminate cytidylyltransferase family protein n=1 Tax=Flavimarina sp. Hel_I_48 TaxID=1392488 RepID=UPI0004DF491E|nr:acylneuraminate cytidylyltransferase family protein [Flavimarina sp. Hel_I_48]